jgi:hypothetical protein
MSSYVELFDLRSGNVMANFADAKEAWEVLRRDALEFGLEELNDLALTHVQDGNPTLIAMEDELVRRVAREMSPDAVSTEARP